MFRKLLNSELGRVSVEEYKKKFKRPVTVVLDNVRSQHNIGSAFRTSDAFRVSGIYLCGISATPPSAEIHKAALGAEFSVEWKYFKETIDAVKELREKGYLIISIEQTENSVTIEKFVYDSLRSEVSDRRPVALVFGNEVHGVKQEAVDMSDLAIEIPQYGTKHSLNVSVAIGIILYRISSLFPITDS